MIDAIRQQATVQLGGVVEVHSADLPVGAEVEVIVLVDSSKKKRSLRSMMGTAQKSFANVEEVDALIRHGRDA
jgi:hypothetical protein